MASKVTETDIENFNELYFKCHNYSQVARETGFSAGTVKKYIVKGYTPKDQLKIKRFNKEDLPPFFYQTFLPQKDLGELCVLSKEEEEEIKELWNELSL